MTEVLVSNRQVDTKTICKRRLFFLRFKIVLTLSCALLNFSVLSLTCFLVPANYISFSFSPCKLTYFFKENSALFLPDSIPLLYLLYLMDDCGMGV